MHIHLKAVINWLCLLPFIGLLAGVLVLDDAFTGGTGIGKGVWFYAVMGLVPIAASVSYWNNRKSLKYQMTDWLVPVFAALAMVVTYLNYPVWNTKMVTLLLLVVLYCALRIVLVQHETNRYALFMALMITALAEAAWGL